MKLKASIILSTVNSSTKSSKTIFQLETFQLKVDQCYPIFHWSWNFLEMFSLISIFKTYLTWRAGDGKSYNYQ